MKRGVAVFLLFVGAAVSADEHARPLFMDDFEGHTAGELPGAPWKEETYKSGSVIRIEQLGEKYDGIYTVMDTGPKVQGRHVDVYLWSCNEALQMGRRPMKLTVLRMGWNPTHSKPSLVNRLFRQREKEASQ